MPAPPPIRQASARVELPHAASAWAVGWVAGILLTALVVAPFVDGDGPTPIPALATSVALSWTAFIGALWWASRRSGTGNPLADYGWRFRTIDLVGLPIGVLAQLVLVPAIYLPLEAIWPDTFSDDRLSENAKELVDRASGATMLVLVLVVVVGAPIVEELVYRGMLQGSLAARVDDTIAVVVVSAWFALIHFRPVEYPGLFAFGVVAGVCTVLTQRLGMATLAHVAFNAVGLYLAWST